MRIGRSIIIPAILALGVAGSAVAGSAIAVSAGQTSSVHAQATGSYASPAFYYLD
jgi:hypothetical protein